MIKSNKFADVPALRFLVQLLSLNLNELAEVVQGTYFRVATTEWGQSPSTDSPYLVETQAELPDDAARETNREAARAFLNGLVDIVMHTNATLSLEWLIEQVRGNIGEIQGQAVMILPLVEFQLYRAWALARIKNQPDHKNLKYGFGGLPLNVKQYDRRIAHALWLKVEAMLEQENS